MDGLAAARLGGIAAEYEPTGVGRGGFAGRRGVHIGPSHLVADVAICNVNIAVPGGRGRAVEARVGSTRSGNRDFDMDKGVGVGIHHDDDVTGSDGV